MIKSLYPKPQHRATINAHNAFNRDIIQTLENNFPVAVAQCKQAHKLFKGATPEETAAKIWLYLRNHCQYKRDPDARQLIRLPSYFVNVTNKDGKPFADCKTFALFARANFAAIYPELKTAFCFTNYLPENGTTPTHVYCCAQDANGKEILMDGCWPRFNSEKDFNFKMKPKFKTMDVVTLSGTGRDPVKLKNLLSQCSPAARARVLLALKNKKRLSDATRLYKAGRMTPATFTAIREDVAESINAPRKRKKKLSKEERRAKRKRSNAKAREVFKKIGRGLNTVNLAPIRGAFTAIVALNVNALAKNLQLLRDDPKTATEWEKIVEIWKNVGGFEKALNKAINIGAKKKILFMSKKARKRFEKRTGLKTEKGRIVSGVEPITIAPAVVAAILATATTIVGAMVPVIVKGLQKKGLKADADAVIEQGQEIVEEAQTDGLRPFSDAQAAPVNPEPGEYDATETEATEATESEEINPEETDAETITGLVYKGVQVDPVAGLSPELQNQLFDSLGKVVGEGIKFTAAAVARKKKKNPKLKKVLDTGGAVVDDYLTGRYLREAGVTPKAKRALSFYDKNKTMIVAGGALALGGLTAYLLTRKK